MGRTSRTSRTVRKSMPEARVGPVQIIPVVALDITTAGVLHHLTEQPVESLKVWGCSVTVTSEYAGL